MGGDATGRGEALPLAKLSHRAVRRMAARGVARVTRAQLAAAVIRINHEANGIENLIRRK